jgi:proteasome lid subunit RPN8/RPN11
MNTRIKHEIIQLAKANPTEEICGFIIHNNGIPRVFPCKNIAEKPSDEFEISSDDYLKALQNGGILGVYHSHIRGAAFSPCDIEHADELCAPYYLYVIEGNAWNEYIPPEYKVELEGMHFIWGFQDCYGLVRAYYRQEQKLYLNDYDRDENFEENHNDIIVKNFEKEGFKIIDNIANIQNGDALIFKTVHALPQHLAIFVGDSKMLHHPQNALSRIDAFSDRWMSRIHLILRHKSESKECNNSQGKA